MNSIRNYVRVRFSQFKALLRGSAPSSSLTTVDSAAKSTTAAAKNLNLIGSTWNHVWSGTYHLLKKFESPVLPEPVDDAQVLPKSVHVDPPVLPEPVDDAPVLPEPVHVDPQVLPEPVHADLVKLPKDSGDRESESEGDNDDSIDDESESDFD